jgi:hypothetical protein
VSFVHLGARSLVIVLDSDGSRDGIRHKSRCSFYFDRGFDPEIYKTSQYPIEIIHLIKQNRLRKGI